jgi:uncharacterized RDD family membrane protein YckC
MVTSPPYSGSPVLPTFPGHPVTPGFAGFWRRVFAFALDMLLLAIIGSVLGVFLFDSFARLGTRGPIVGFVLCLLYFGTLNSAIGRGQTIGKRWRQIRVVNQDGNTITPGTSCLRAAVLFLPLLHGAILPASVSTTRTSQMVEAFFAVIAVAIVYLDIFNRGTRQSLHDLAAKTYVVEARTSGRLDVPEIWPGHSVVIILLLVSILVATPIVTRKVFQMGPFPQLLSIQQAVQRSPEVNAASVQIVKNFTSGGTRTLLNVTAFWRERPKDMSRAADDVASRVLAVDPRALGCDFLLVGIIFGYDIGIAHANISRGFEYSPEAWQQRLSPPSSSPEK